MVLEQSLDFAQPFLRKFTIADKFTNYTAKYTVNLEIFARVLFSRNFADAKFREI